MCIRDSAYVANMLKADFYKKSLVDEAHLCKHIKCYLCLLYTSLAAINSRNPRELFDQIKIARFDFIEDICLKRPANNKFKRGWMNRINDIKFEG